MRAPEGFPTRVLQVAAAGGSLPDLLAGIRELPVAKLLLVHEEATASDAARICARMKELSLDVECKPILGDPVLGVLGFMSRLVRDEADCYDEIHLNVSSGPRRFGCAGTAAASVLGVRAFHVLEGKPVFLPLMRFGHHELLSGPKKAILRALHESDGAVDGLRDLMRLTRIEKPLLSYHLRGNSESRGLEQMGLLEVRRGPRGRLHVALTPLGLMLATSRAASEATMPRPGPAHPDDPI